MKFLKYFIAVVFMITFISQIQASQDFIIGADISALPVMEQKGVIYIDHNKPQDLISILKNNGFNTIRLRLFVNPVTEDIVTNNLQYTLNLAKRAKSRKMKLLLNFHYSDTWADPQQQIKPAAWQNMSFDELKNTMQSYTASVIKEFKNAGVLPDMVQIGNEITPGMLWPDGKLNSTDGNQLQWEKFTSLLKAGIAGVKSVVPDKKIKIMIHIDQGGKKSVSQWFFSNLNKYQVDYDIIGVSYYPWWHGKTSDLKENLDYIALELKKDIVVVETAYPHKEQVDWHGHPPEGKMEFPLSPQGQYDMLYKVAKIVRSTPDKRGIGVCYWFPESIEVNKKGWLSGSAALFDEKGNSLMSIHAFSDALNQ